MKNFPFRIKICGVRTDGDLRAVSIAGGDCVGLNCYRPSPRYVDADRGRQLCELARELNLCVMALFVEDDLSAILRTIDDWQIANVQLHGDQQTATALDLIDRNVDVLRAVRLPPGEIEASAIERQVRPWEAVGCSILFDADVGSAFGGAGTRIDWESISAWSRWRTQRDSVVPVYALAGGLTPQIVAAAIAASGATAVDVASGVESVRGVKDHGLVAEFCRFAFPV
jgi:phosphoribosylanthranilate isomerase